MIIPIYNTASYLKECIDSVLNQSFKDIEVICVNDGSNDASLDILNSYKSKDDRVKIISQENKGLAAARNVAVRQARGKYVLFLDSDDYLEKDALIEVYDLAESKSLDLVMFKIINFDNETYETSKFPYFEMNFLKKTVDGEVFTWRHVQKYLFNISVTCPGKFFRMDLIRNLRFPEGLIFEDNVFFMEVIFKAKRIYFYDKYLYYRRLRNDSITNSYYDKFSDCVEIYDLVEESLRQSGKYRIFSTQLFNRKCKDFFSRFAMVSDEYKKDFYDKIKDNFLKNQKSLERDGILYKCSKRSLKIYNSAINSQTYREFELSVNLFDLKRDYDKLKLDFDISNRNYEYKIYRLKKDNRQSEHEIDELKNSTSWRFTEIFRRITDSLKK